MSHVHIPRPCAESWAALQPTAAGWHCTRCQHEVVDFTCMRDEEVLTYLAAHVGKRVCGVFAAPLVMPRHYERKRSVRQWLLTVAALFGWNYTSASGLPPQSLPVWVIPASLTTVQANVTIQGVVLDDLSGAPVPGAYVFVDNTKYGAITDEQGRFILLFPADWEPVKNRALKLVVPRIPFNTQEQTVEVELGSGEIPAPLTIRLRADKHRGWKGKAEIIDAPIPLSELRKESR